MLINMKEMLSVARKNNFAVGAFNTTDLCLFRSAVETAEMLNAPAIIEVSFGEFTFATAEFYTYVRQRLTQSKVPFVLHLDHGASFEQCLTVMRAGFTSVMLDGSMLSYEENVALTKKVVDTAKILDVSVEGEIGTIGKALGSDEEGVTNITYTKPEEAVDFVSKTGVDSLAIAIGTAHGLYPKNFAPNLQIKLLKEINAVSPVPLVLHGGSDNPDEEIGEACKSGINKVNISTDFKKAFFKEVKEYIDKTPSFIPANIYNPGITSAKKVIAHKIRLFGSENKAQLY